MTRLSVLVLAAALQLPSGFQPARVVSSPFGGFPYGSRAAGVVVLDVEVDQQPSRRPLVAAKLDAPRRG